MTITNAQRIERRMWIGSSDVAAICGVDPYRSIVDVWYSKVFGSQDSGGNKYTRSGDYAEEGLLRFAEDQLGVDQGSALRNAQFKREHNGTPYSVNLDGWLEDQALVIEAKKTGQVHEWGRVGTDEVPDKVIFQVHAQMFCSGGVKAMVVVDLCFRGSVMEVYWVERNEGIIEFMHDCCSRFWHENVLCQVKPDGPAPRSDTLTLLNREPEITAELPQRLVDKWLDARKQLSLWKKEKDKLDREIKQELEFTDEEGQVHLAEIGLAEGGYIDYSPSPKGRRALNWKAEPWKAGDTS